MAHRLLFLDAALQRHSVGGVGVGGQLWIYALYYYAEWTS